MNGFSRRIEGNTQLKNYPSQFLASRQMFNRSIGQKEGPEHASMQWRHNQRQKDNLS